uniref:Uncharacterized protein n=1 Tax=Hucho hucho TaxID=62062 RepID=A0A4W5L8P3_9TELE
MNRLWSVDELQARKQQVTEFEVVQHALSKVTACFQQMATSVRRNSRRICTGKATLVPLTERETGQENRELWVLFLTGLENRQQDLYKASDVIDHFPLKQRNDNWALVKTGASDGVSRVAASVQTPLMHITQIDATVMLQKVRIPFWAVEATEKAWVEGAQSQDECDWRREVVSQDGIIPQTVKFSIDLTNLGCNLKHLVTECCQ